MFGQGKLEDEKNKMLDTFNTEKQLFRIKQGPYERGHIWKIHLLDDQLSHLWHQQYYIGAAHIFGEVARRLTSKILGISSSEYWKDVKIIRESKYPDECIYSCFNNYLTYSFPICVQTRGKGPKFNARRKRKCPTASPRYLKGVTRRSPSTIGLFFRKTLVNLTASLK